MPDGVRLISEAIVLAAGNGDRFRDGSTHSKLLKPVAGVPLLVRTLTSAAQAGIREAHVVLGYDAKSVRALAESGAPRGLTLHFHYNRDWHRENGLSVLAARDGVGPRPFALMMGDHLFEPHVLRRLRQASSHPSEILLGVDRQPTDPATAMEATKVRLCEDRVVEIGKSIDPYDALDTGLFVCRPSLFDALEESNACGDSTLSAGVARLAARGQVRGIDIGLARWCDVDTVDDLEAAERIAFERGARSE